MRRRQLLRYAISGIFAAMATSLTSQWQVARSQSSPQTPNNTLSIQWCGHTCFLFKGNGKQILVNPFRPIGCTAGYRAPKLQADLVLISSLLLDEGATEGLPGSPKLLSESGVYQLDNMQIQGIGIPHDRMGGRRFGTNVAWRWTQAGIDILHLGGAAAPIDIEQQILMGRPDVLLIPVGGGPKAYDPQEAKQAIEILNPKLVIPTHYRTQAADDGACDLVPLDEFLALMDGTPVRRSPNSTLTLTPQQIPETGPVIQTFSYKFAASAAPESQPSVE
jgi:L-ascorbate metabolism protein UlaG (beta-lactamase superfamily)